MALPDWAQSKTEDGRFATAGGGVVKNLSQNMVGTIVQVLNSIVATVVLSRILMAEDYGVYGMIIPFATMLFIVIDGGGAYYMLRSEKVTERIANGLFWYCVACGATGGVILTVALPGISWFMEESRVVWAGLALAMGMVFQGANTQYTALTMRCFRNDIRIRAMIWSTLAGSAIGVVLALAGAGYWALVMTMVSRLVLACLLSIYFSGWVPGPPRWDRELFADVVRLARPTIGSRVIYTLVQQSDKIIVGALYSTASVGYYAFAQMLSTVPLSQIVGPSTGVIMPWLTEFKSDREQMFNRFWDVLKIFIYLTLAPCFFGSLFASGFFEIVLGPEMQPASVPFRILILTAVSGLVYIFTTIPFQVMDRPDILERQHLGLAFISAGCYAIAALDTRFETIALATLVASLIGLAIRVRRNLIFFEVAAMERVAELLKITAISLIPGILVLLVSGVGRAGERSGYVVVDMAIYSLLFSTIFLALGCWYFKYNPRDLLKVIRGRRRKAG